MNELHFHVCENCRNYWVHEKQEATTREAWAVYHKCPKCSSGPYSFAYESVRDAMEVVKHLVKDETPASEVFGRTAGLQGE